MSWPKGRPRKGLFHHSEETKREMSRTRKGKKLNLTPEARLNRSLSRRGKPGRVWTPEQRVAASVREKAAYATGKKVLPTKTAEQRQQQSKRRKGVVCTTEQKHNMSVAHLGNAQSEESKRKISTKLTGIKRSPETRQRMSLAKKKSGFPSPTQYYVSALGHQVRSSYEERMGKKLKELGLNYAYEKPFTITLADSSQRTYSPDFVLDDNTVIETKGFFRTSYEIEKINLFVSQYPDYKLYVVGANPDILKMTTLKVPFSFELKTFEELEQLLRLKLGVK